MSITKPNLIKMENDTYDALKFVALVVIPLLATLYAVASFVWPTLPPAKDVVGALTGVDTILGTVLHVSAKSYLDQAATNANKINSVVPEVKPIAEAAVKAAEAVYEIKNGKPVLESPATPPKA